MGILVAQPSDILLPYVKQYWSIESNLSGSTEYIHRIIPSGLIELMFFLKRPPVVLDTQKEFEENSIISGHQKGYYDMQIRDELSLFSVSFEPYGAMMFFKIPLSELFNKNVALNCLIRQETHELESKLQETPLFQQRVQLMNQFLLEQLHKNYKSFEHQRILHAINLINRHMGLVDIDFLADQACLSRKQFERTFNENIGASPKQFLRAVRFQHVLYTRQTKPELNLTQLAYQCGYYDQAHMINDFRALSGKTPGAYFSECEPYSDYFTTY